MSYLVIQAGNRGNLLGHSFFAELSEITSKTRNAKNYEFLDKSDSRFFSYNDKEDKKHAHAICLYSDPQVVQEITKLTKNSWYYKKDCYKRFTKDSFSSWNQGYEVHGPLCKEFILDAVRQEIEHYDQFYGFLLFGSIFEYASCGVTSYITELLCDEYPSVSLVNISVLPFPQTTPEYYNGVLNLSSLQNFSDAIIILEDDYLMKLCMKMGMEQSSHKEYNLIASQQLTNLFLPVDNYCSTLNDMLSLLVPHPQFKIVNLQSVPQEPLSSLSFCSYDWSTLFRNLRRMHLYSTGADEVYGKNNSPSSTTSLPVSLTNLLILRGKNCESANINYFHKPQFPYASWVPKSSRMNIWTHSSPFLSCDRTALLANNGQLSVNCVDKMAECAWKGYSHRLYFHLFDYHGLTPENFYPSLMNVQQIVSSYKSLKV